MGIIQTWMIVEIALRVRASMERGSSESKQQQKCIYVGTVSTLLNANLFFLCIMLCLSIEPLALQIWNEPQPFYLVIGCSALFIFVAMIAANVGVILQTRAKAKQFHGA